MDHMRLTKIVGVCLVAAFALSAFAFSASSASAANTAEYGQCVKVAKAAKGLYENEGCTKLAAKKGSYEWIPGVSPSCEAKKKGKYKDAGCTELDEKNGKGKGKFEKTACAFVDCSEQKISSGPNVLKEQAGHTEPVDCTESHGIGHITGVKTGEQIIHLTGCTVKIGPGTFQCTSPGAATGEVVTDTLDAELISNASTGKGGHEPVVGEVWNQYHGAGAGEEITAFECPNPFTGNIYFKVKGYLSGPIEPIDIPGLVSEQELNSSVGEQGTETQACVGAPGCAEPYRPGYQTVAKAKSEFNDNVEVRTEV